MEETKPKTPFIEGATYTKPIRDRVHPEKVVMTLVGTLQGSVSERGGPRRGLIVNGLQLVETVGENDGRLDEWTIVSEPVPVGVLAGLQATVTDLKQQLEALKASILPQSDRAPSAVQELANTKQRSRVSGDSSSIR